MRFFARRPVWFQLKNAPMPWGDYGAILLSGMTARRDAEGRIGVQRAGPFVPPVTLAGISDLIVTDAFRQSLETSPLNGLAFKEAVARRIVHLPWKDWDLSAPDPMKYPAGDEPENYILGRKHSAEAEAAVGPLWEAVVSRLVADPGDADIVRVAPTPFTKILVSTRARDWLSDNAGEWLSFVPMER